MGVDLNDAVANAKKVLGKDAKIPSKHIPEIGKRWEAVLKLSKSFAAARITLESHLLDFQDAVAKYKNGVSQAEDEITTSEFGLDGKDSDNKKKIDQAQKIFVDWFKDANANADDATKSLKELDKHLMNLSKYKGPG